MTARRFLSAAILVIVTACGWLHDSASADDGGPVSVLHEGPQAGHYLIWRDRPLLLIGDSVTQGWMECGDHFDQDAYVDALADRGINLLMLWAFKGTNSSLQQADERIGYDAPELWPWMGAPDGANFNLLEFNPEYFVRLRQLVERAEQRGIVVLITVHDGWTKTCFEGHPFNHALGNGPLSDRRQYVELADYDHEMPEVFQPDWTRQQQNQFFQERFCARLVAELSPCTNVIYEMFNEGEWYDREQRSQHERHFLRFFRARCANLLLSNCDHLSHFSEHDEVNLDVITLHPQGWTGQAAKFIDGFQRAPSKPYLYSEPVPEFDGQEPALEIVRRSMWETALAGAGWVNQNDVSFSWDAQASIGSRSDQRDAAYDMAGHCARFFNQHGVRFWEMAPEADLASTGACLARPGDEYVVYAHEGGDFSVNLSAAAGTTLLTRWYDPCTGEFVSGTAVIGGDESQLFRAPFSGDAVLHITSGGFSTEPDPRD